MRANYGAHGPNGVYSYPPYNIPSAVSGNITVDTTEQKEEKYSIDVDDDQHIERVTLRTKHILMADAFIIF